MPSSFLSTLFRFSRLPFLPHSGLMENADYAGFIYASFRRLFMPPFGVPQLRVERLNKYKVGSISGSF
jgi:hypothetical protein